MRLIDISPLIKAQDICEDMECRDCELEVRDCESMMDLLMKMPTIDAVPVVRCKDCKYWHREIYNGIEYFNFSSCDLNHHGDGRNFYCADAERKEE